MRPERECKVPELSEVSAIGRFDVKPEYSGLSFRSAKALREGILQFLTTPGSYEKMPAKICSHAKAKAAAKALLDNQLDKIEPNSTYTVRYDGNGVIPHYTTTFHIGRISSRYFLQIHPIEPTTTDLEEALADELDVPRVVVAVNAEARVGTVDDYWFNIDLGNVLGGIVPDTEMATVLDSIVSPDHPLLSSYTVRFNYGPARGKAIQYHGKLEIAVPSNRAGLRWPKLVEIRDRCLVGPAFRVSEEGIADAPASLHLRVIEAQSSPIRSMYENPPLTKVTDVRRLTAAAKHLCCQVYQMAMRL